MLGKKDVFNSKPDARVLVVILHGHGGSPGQFFDIRDRAVWPAVAAADVFLPSLPYRSVLCSLPMADIVADVAKRIEWLWTKKRELSGQTYESIVLIGYSFGSQPARAVLVHAWGADDPTWSLDGTSNELTQPRYEWAPAIKRIVLLAGVNRGISFESPLATRFRTLWNLAHVLGVFIRKPTILEIRRGSPFLTELRLKWLELWPRLGPRAPVVVQLLGTKDDVVDPADNLDLYAGRDFHYVEVPFTGHTDIIEVADKGSERRRAMASARVSAMILALRGTEADLKQRAFSMELLGDPADLEEAEEVKDVVFVVHGIRDYGFWTQKIGRQIRQRGGSQVRIVNPSYGYFPILSFALPWVRRQKVDWLMDKYVEVRKRYPNAAVSYVGHSNGTYLLARALQEYPSARFKHVVFAGSVVRTDYEWSKIARVRLGKIINFVATADWVVALFPKGLEPLRAFDLGSAGHDGFRDSPTANVRFVAGQHDAGITEHHWGEIAKFILHGTEPEPPEKSQFFRKRRRIAVVAMGLISTLLLLVAFGSIVAVAAILAAAVFGFPAWTSNTTVGAWLLADPVIALLLLLGYLAVLRFVFTRF
jgi:pimeloyl-ACP methyl ester carboxylesterase